MSLTLCIPSYVFICLTCLCLCLSVCGLYVSVCLMSKCLYRCLYLFASLLSVMRGSACPAPAVATMTWLCVVCRKVSGEVKQTKKQTTVASKRPEEKISQNSTNTNKNKKVRKSSKGKKTCQQVFIGI